MKVELKNLEKNKNVLNKELLNSYIEALKNPEFKALITKLKIKEDIAMKYTSKLERTMDELKNCKNCQGLDYCKNPCLGCVYYPKKDNNRLDFNYVACKYLKKKEKDEESRSKFFLEPIQIEEAKMSDIDLKDKNRVNLIKWVNKFYKDYQNDKHIKGLYLHGSFGSGKTYILAALLNELSKNKVNSVIIYYPEMLRNLKESFGIDFDIKMDILKNADILLIDDIGAESVSAWSRDEILGTILQYRMDSKLPTFLTSNLNIDELESHLAETKEKIDILKAKRIIERIKQLTEDMELISKNRRN